MKSSEFTFMVMFVHYFSTLVIMFSRSYLFFDVWCKLYFFRILDFVFRSEQNNAKETDIDKAQQSWYFYRHIFFLVHYFTLWQATHVKLDWCTFLQLIKTEFLSDKICSYIYKKKTIWHLAKLVVWWILSRTTDAQRGNSLHCKAENSIPIPNF